jgi:hypothetical protein
MPRPKKNTTLDIIQASLVDNPGNPRIKLTTEQQQIKKRWISAFVFWVEEPTLPDKKIVNFLVNEFGIGERQAYTDLISIKQLLGNVSLASKQWYRYLVLNMAHTAFDKAKDKDDPGSMVAAGNLIVKATQLDKAEIDDLPWDQMVPPNFEPSPDISVLGFRPDPNIEEKRRKMREKYLRQYDPEAFTDAELVD